MYVHTYGNENILSCNYTYNKIRILHSYKKTLTIDYSNVLCLLVPPI